MTTTINTPAFVQEWTSEQFSLMKKAIRKHFLNSWLRTTNSGDYMPAMRSFTSLDQILGLAYTSSSSCAGYWICNVDLLNEANPGYRYVGFVLGDNKKAYAILQDKNEKQIIIEL